MIEIYNFKFSQARQTRIEDVGFSLQGAMAPTAGKMAPFKV